MSDFVSIAGVVIIVLVGVVGAVIYLYKIDKSEKEKKNETETANAQFKESLIAKGFNIDKATVLGPAAFFVDYKNKHWSIKENNSSYPVVYNFSDLIDFSLVDNDGVDKSKMQMDLLRYGEEKYKENLKQRCSYIGIALNVKEADQTEKKLDILTEEEYHNKGRTNSFDEYGVFRISDMYRSRIVTARNIEAELKNIKSLASS